MTRRALTLILAVALLAGVTALVLGCSSSGGTTTSTTAVSETTAISGEATSPATDTSSSTEMAASSSTSTKETDELSTTTSVKPAGSSANYATLMKAWVVSLSGMPDTEVFDVSDPAKATAADLTAAKDAAAEAHKYLSALNNLTPTSALADIHQNIVEAFQGLVAAFDSYVVALQEKSADGIAESKDVGQAAESQLEKYFSQLAPKIGLSG
jgi:hypothetical protein